MSKQLALIPITGLVLLTLAGCATTTNGTGANNNQVTNSVANSTSSTSDANAVSNSTGTANNIVANTDTANYASEIALIKGKGYSVNGTTPNASVQTNSGDTLTAWIGVAIQGDGHNQFVFFFLSGKYLGTDTAKPSAQITSAKPAGTGSISITYPVYKKNDSFAKPTGVPDTITYHWNGSKLITNKPYPKQFS